MIAKAGNAYGATTRNAIAKRRAASHTGHREARSWGRTRRANRAKRADAPRAITSCSLRTRAPTAVPVDDPTIKWTRRNPASPGNATSRTLWRAPHVRFASNRSRMFRYRRVGEPIRRPAVTAAIGAKTAGLETARTTRTIAPMARTNIASTITQERARFMAKRETCRSRGRNRRTTALAARRPANRYARSVSWLIRGPTATAAKDFPAGGGSRDTFFHPPSMGPGPLARKARGRP